MLSVNKSSMTKKDIILAELRNLFSEAKDLKTVKEDDQVMQKRMDGYKKKLDDLTRKVEAGRNDDKMVQIMVMRSNRDLTSGVRILKQPAEEFVLIATSVEIVTIRLGKKNYMVLVL